MANLVKCDRCGKIMSEKECFRRENNSEIFVLNGSLKIGKYDLCKECTKKLYDWIKKGEK